MKAESYVNFRMREWNAHEHPVGLQRAIRSVLSELTAAGLLALRDPRFQVLITPGSGHNAWSYFPVHRHRWIFREHASKVNPSTRVLMVLGGTLERDPAFKGNLRDALGHALLYLRKPKARNDCPDAMKEWKGNCE